MSVYTDINRFIVHRAVRMKCDSSADSADILPLSQGQEAMHTLPVTGTGQLHGSSAYEPTRQVRVV